MQSPSLCRLALQAWAWCREQPVAGHFSGSKNILADTLSSWKHRHPTEWSMHKVMVALMFEHWPTPHVDLFASEKYRKLPVFFSARPSRTSSESNALTQNWEHLYGYTFPPFSLIRRILTKQVAAVIPDPIGCTVLAQSTVVPSADEHADGSPTGDQVPGQPPEALGHRNVLPRAGQAKASCMASVSEFFIDRLFSAEVGDTAAGARR